MIPAEGSFSSLKPLAGSMNADAIASTKAETHKLVEAAKSGGFKIEEGAVHGMIDSITKMRDRLKAQMAFNDALRQVPQLGSHDYGYTVAAHDQKGADNEAGSANVVLQQFDQVLVQATEALQRAAGIYDETEATAQSDVATYNV
ncbi:hypothetical protein [Amycolatopsis albispora]|uniref:Uncharacterized protein n=1 Tax=Amycolatopsis albispora TaxID=1804986 RepID=A0A344LCU2_9PSEU|nr:hypothetical protein [Amycolatopsis albispora]AXB45866.1 hypothetical protein A4R43_28100 [Amycolatopsis albispora]